MVGATETAQQRLTRRLTSQVGQSAERRTPSFVYTIPVSQQWKDRRTSPRVEMASHPVMPQRRETTSACPPSSPALWRATQLQSWVLPPLSPHTPRKRTVFSQSSFAYKFLITYKPLQHSQLYVESFVSHPPTILFRTYPLAEPFTVSYTVDTEA